MGTKKICEHAGRASSKAQSFKAQSYAYEKKRRIRVDTDIVQW